MGRGNLTNPLPEGGRQGVEVSMRNKVNISGDGFYAPEVFDAGDVKQHKVLLELENGKKYSMKAIAKTVYLYTSRRNTLEFDPRIKSKTPGENSNSPRSEVLQRLILEAAMKCGLQEKVENYLKNGKVKGNFGRLELEFLKQALAKMGWSKDMFVFD